MEGWLREVYRTLRKEPNRPFLPYSRQEVEELKQEHNDEGVKPESQPSSEEDEREFREEGVSGQALITALLSQAQAPGFGREIKISGSSLGSDNLYHEHSDDGLHETSVDVDLGDEEYADQVLQRVMSESPSPPPPSSPSLSPTSPPIAGESSVDPVGEEWAEGMEEEEEEGRGGGRYGRTDRDGEHDVGKHCPCWRRCRA